MKYDVRNFFAINGNLEIDLWFVECFKNVPDFYSYYDENLKMNTNFLTLEKCKELFGNVDIRISFYEHLYSTSKAEDECYEYDCTTGGYKGNRYPTITLVNYDEEWIANINENSIKIRHYHLDANDIVQRIIKVIPIQKEQSKTASIDLVAYDRNYYTINSKIKRTNVDFNINYNDDIKVMHENLLKFLNERESGLAVLHGVAGSGKTHYIKHLLSNTDKKYILVTNSIAAHMAEPEFIAFMMENKDSIFILEDCEQILMAREENRFGGAISNILNMSDGLMSDIFNIKFICTFNTDIENIDKALLRPGRCYVNYEFKPLCKEKSINLLKSLGHEVDASREMTLAEIYNYNKEQVDKPKVKKMGF